MNRILAALIAGLTLGFFRPQVVERVDFLRWEWEMTS